MARKASKTKIFDRAYENIVSGVEEVMNEAGDEICMRMQDKLISNGHVDTGALLNSIHYKTVTEGTKINTYIYADAKSEEGTQYAEFIEEGTGAAHGRQGGRVGYWRYKDRNGNWHTTNGMDADPFIKPATEEVLPDFDNMIDKVLYDFDKYGK